MGIIALTVTATGPIGIIVAFRAIVLARSSQNKFATAALCILAACSGLIYSLHIVMEGDPIHAWREFVLIALLPVFAIGHLVYLARSVAGNVAAK